MKQLLCRSTPKLPGRAWHGLFFLCALAFVLTACGGNQQTQQSQATAAPLPSLPPIGGRPPGAANLQPSGTLPPDTLLQLTIGLATNRQAFAKDLAAIYDPASPQYQHYLTPQELASRYGASQDTINTVTSFLSDHGFQINGVSSLRNSVSVAVTAGEIEQAFHIALSVYQMNGATVFGANTTLSIPTQLQSLVTSVIGLSTFAQPFRRAPSQAGALKAQTSAARLDPQDDCIGGLAGLSPNDVASAYHYNDAYKAHYTGKGINIGVIEFNDNVSNDDINIFLSCTTGGQFHRSIIKVDGSAQIFDDGSTGEATLDLEYLAALAPDAQLLEYQTTYCPGTDTSFECQKGQKGVAFPKGYADLLNQMAADGRVQVVSSSWGTGEDYFTPDEIFMIDQGIQYLAAEGVTLASASGDCAAFGDGIFNRLAVTFPASDPYALAVGGTELTVNGSGSRSSEVVWEDANPDKSQCNNTWGSGGGLSTVFSLAPWQQGTGVKNQYSNGKRQVPDVAAAADNLFLVFDFLPLTVGGTSAAAPIWAAGIALVDQGLQQHHKQVVGASASFYRLANHHGSLNPYYDVTRGKNLYYPATSGWDYPTGWGAPSIVDVGKALGGF
jgi:kumamolisin